MCRPGIDLLGKIRQIFIFSYVRTYVDFFRHKNLNINFFKMESKILVLNSIVRIHGPVWLEIGKTQYIMYLHIFIYS